MVSVNKALPSIFAGGILFALSVTAGVFGMTDVAKQTPRSDRSEWMKSYGDDTLVSSLSIPGSHDTLALYGIGDLAGQCQSLGIADQLTMGVRFLDIRLKEDGDSLKAVHGIVDERQAFSTTVSTMVSFLQSHPSETLFVSVKEEAASVNANASFDSVLRS